MKSSINICAVVPFQRNADGTGFVGILQSLHHKVSLCGKEKTSVQKCVKSGQTQISNKQDKLLPVETQTVSCAGLSRLRWHDRKSGD